jgi:hypothetical protein
MKRVGPTSSMSFKGKKLARHTKDNRSPATKPKKSGTGGVGSGSGVAGGWLGKGK